MLQALSPWEEEGAATKHRQQELQEDVRQVSRRSSLHSSHGWEVMDCKWYAVFGMQVMSDQWSSACLGMEVIYAMKLKSITYAIRVPECWLTTWLHLQLIWRCKSPKLCKVIIHLASCTLQGWEVGFSVPLRGGRYAPVPLRGGK